MKGLSFSNKTAMMLLGSCFIVAIFIAGVALFQKYSAAKLSLGVLRTTLYNDFDHNAKAQVEAAISILNQYYERSQKGEITLDEAKDQAAKVLAGIRYDKGNYLWADTVEGINIVLPDKSKNGTSRINLQDKRGHFIIKEILANGRKEGGGYTDYWFPRAGSDTPLPKRSYSLEFKPFEWVIGTGNYVDDLETMVQKEYDKVTAALKRDMLVFAAIIFCSLVVAFVFSRLFSKSLLKTLGGEPALIADIANQIAAGNLVFQHNQDANGILKAMQDMATKLRSVMSEISDLANLVAKDGQNLQTNIASMAQGAHENAAQAGTVAVASEEMAATSGEIANNCHMAADSAQHAADTTQQGFNVVKHTVGGIRERGALTRQNAKAISSLGERSDQIGAIVATIEDIADQTNLLALNAAIEAARAGEMGRGFAVVADEVRALAERTTKATKEISDMIRAIQVETRQAIISMEEGVKETEKGAHEAGQLEVALQNILEQVNVVTMQVSQIATAAEEQTATTSEITNNIHQISEISQQASVTAQASAEATEHLAQISGQLKNMVHQFKL